MTTAGYWIVGLALVYTLLLVGIGNVARKRAVRGEDFFIGGRSFTPMVVAFCITGLFSGSSFIAILELSYHTGVSAVWYGVAESVQVLLIALVLIGPFRKRMLVTVSGLIGDRFGRAARGLAGAITTFAFLMWSVATAIAFASALHVFTGLSLHTSVVFTALLLLLYLWGGGMWSIAFTQMANCVVLALMLGVGLVAFAIEPGWSGLVQLVRERPAMADPAGAGTSLILAWFGTFIVNVILAQAAFQMALSCRTAGEGRRGMYYALGMGLPFIVLGVVFGMAAAAVVPGEARGLVAVPLYLAEVLPAPLVGLFFLGIWACALGWGAPCQFSGATSLGRDVGRALRPGATEAELVRYTRGALLLLTGLMIGFAFLRTEQSAWWNVLAWSLRNGATFAPVMAALFWPAVTRRAVLAALSAGFLASVAWYHLGEWHPDRFYLGVHPVWIGMSTNLFALVAVTAVERARRPGRAGSRQRLGSAAAAGLVLSVTAAGWSWLQQQGLSGLALFATVLLVSAATFAGVEPVIARHPDAAT